MTAKNPRRHSERQAYVPEQAASYVESVSGAETFLVGDFTAYRTGGSLVFVAYPLSGSCAPGQAESALDEALRRFKPKQTSLIGPDTLAPPSGFRRTSLDHYYVLDLRRAFPPKAKNMVTRASRELIVRRSRAFGTGHRDLVDQFLSSHTVEGGTAYILGRLQGYLTRVETAWIFEAWDWKDKLAGFTVGEFCPQHWAFYMFNFRSPTLSVPGTSDLLLYSLLQHARETGKASVNLGLGIHGGVAHFKEKWGAKPLLSYARWDCTPPGGGILSLLQDAIRQMR